MRVNPHNILVTADKYKKNNLLTHTLPSSYNAMFMRGGGNISSVHRQSWFFIDCFSFLSMNYHEFFLLSSQKSLIQIRLSIRLFHILYSPHLKNTSWYVTQTTFSYIFRCYYYHTVTINQLLFLS